MQSGHRLVHERLFHVREIRDLLPRLFRQCICAILPSADVGVASPLPSGLSRKAARQRLKLVKTRGPAIMEAHLLVLAAIGI